MKLGFAAPVSRNVRKVGPRVDLLHDADGIGLQVRHGFDLSGLRKHVERGNRIDA